MVQIGFHASHEQFAPSRLLQCVRRAEQAGFAAAMCSDHFHPWSARQGQSGFTWSWLGAALEATRLSFGTVCAPGQRYHPAVIAQAAATLAEMYPGRLWLAVGSGENLNEHITGEAWPGRDERDARLRESVDIMRALWRGETVSHQGTIRVDRAKLYTRPERVPAIIGAAITAETAQWMGGWADGLITVGHKPDTLRQILDAFRAGGGAGKPVFLQAALSYAPTEEEAVYEAHHQWRHCVLEGGLFADLATPEEFDAACDSAPPEEVRKRLYVSSDLSWHAQWLRRQIELGFDAIYLHHVGRNLERFIDHFGEHVLPALQ
jgi:coenzyme F420-dependent glucose-6-phosphate dehydrogenase